MSEKRFLAGLSQAALEDLAALGANLAEARKARGFSQRAMAERCLMALSTYQALEKGSPAASLGALLAVLDLLDMSDGLRNIAAPQLDPVGMRARARKRVRR